MRWRGSRGYGSLWVVIAIASLLTSCGLVRRALEPRNTAVYFSPDGGGTEAIVREIDEARQRIWVLAYSFTSAPIAEALVAAHKRGVEVLAVLDKSNQTGKYTAATFLTNAGITTLIDDQHAIAHNKVMVIDDRTLITGSFNFTKAAETRNAENLLVMNHVPDLARMYARNIVVHLRHSQAYQFTGEILPAPVARQKSSSRQTRVAIAKPPRVMSREVTDRGAVFTPPAKQKAPLLPMQIAAVRVAPAGGEVRANRRSKVYRTIGCHGYDLINPDNQVVFVSEQKAIAAGYRKAEVCP